MSLVNQLSDFRQGIRKRCLSFSHIFPQVTCVVGLPSGLLHTDCILIEESSFSLSLSCETPSVLLQPALCPDTLDRDQGCKKSCARYVVPKHLSGQTGNGSPNAKIHDAVESPESSTLFMNHCQSMLTVNLSRGIHISMMSLTVGVCVSYACECRCLQKPGEDVRSPGGGVTGYCKLPTTGAGNRTPASARATGVLSAEHLSSLLPCI